MDVSADSVQVHFQRDAYQGMPSGMPLKARPMTGFSRCGRGTRLSG